MSNKLGLYPGSFNPFHDGHRDILKKALNVFDLVIIAVGINPDKEDLTLEELNPIPRELLEDRRIKLIHFRTLLADVVAEHKPTAIIRGLRNGQDFEYEKTQQYWNEDLGCKAPTVYFISDRILTHISSSAIRAVGRFK